MAGPIFTQLMEPIPSKRCPGCGMHKPPHQFSKDSRKKTGLQTRCKECAREWRVRNKDRIAAKNYVDYWGNRTERLAKSAAWLAANKVKKAKTTKAWQQRNVDRIERWKKENEESQRRYQADYYRANAEKKKSAARAYRLANPDKIYARNAKQRARKRGAGGSHTASDIRQLLDLQRARCAHGWCRKSLSAGYHVDHIVSLAKGGSNDKLNLQLLCPHCNIGKRDRDPIEFAQRHGMLL